MLISVSVEMNMHSFDEYYFACASQPAVRPIDGGSIDPVFSHNAEY